MAVDLYTIKIWNKCQYCIKICYCKNVFCNQWLFNKYNILFWTITSYYGHERNNNIGMESINSNNDYYSTISNMTWKKVAYGILQASEVSNCTLMKVLRYIVYNWCDLSDIIYTYDETNHISTFYNILFNQRASCVILKMHKLKIRFASLPCIE